MGPEIGQHRKINSTHFFRERFVRERRINAYAQDLSVSGLELFPLLFEVGEFLLSAAGEIERVKTEDNVLFTLILL
jgi:hypothetical protein